MAYATTDDLALLLGVTFDAADTARAELLLDLASGRIDSVAEQELSEVSDEQITIDGTGTDLIVLPAWPVSAVSSVVEDGETLAVDDDYRWSEAGMLRRVDAKWPSTERSVEVTYTHGHATVPEVVRSVALGIAAVWWTNPARKQSESIGDYMYRVASTPNAEVDAELARIRPYAAGSVR